MASSNYIYHKMLNNVYKRAVKIGSIRLNECIGKLLEGLKTLQLVVKIWFLTQNDEDVFFLFRPSYQRSSMKHRHKEAHNIIL